MNPKTKFGNYIAEHFDWFSQEGVIDTACVALTESYPLLTHDIYKENKIDCALNRKRVFAIQTYSPKLAERLGITEAN